MLLCCVFNKLGSCQIRMTFQCLYTDYSGIYISFFCVDYRLYACVSVLFLLSLWVMIVSQQITDINRSIDKNIMIESAVGCRGLVINYLFMRFKRQSQVVKYTKTEWRFVLRVFIHFSSTFYYLHFIILQGFSLLWEEYSRISTYLMPPTPSDGSNVLVVYRDRNFQKSIFILFLYSLADTEQHLWI